MAMYDWNHNGKNDMQDDYLEYMIYKDCTNDNNSNTNHSSYNRDSSFGMNVFVVIAVIVIFAFIGNAMEESTPKCIKPGCNNEQAKNSSSSSYDSYDEGYDDIYMNGDYDYDRYDSDYDYAAGVDDAMDEDYEEW